MSWNRSEGPVVADSGHTKGNKRGILMKTLKCDRCEVTAEGETFEEWMKALRPHYAEAHADVMNDPSYDHGKEHMEKWMTENKARFEAA